MTRSLKLALGAGVLVVAGCSEPLTPNNADVPPTASFSEFASPGSHAHVMPTRANYFASQARPGGGGGGGTGIFYHGGPVVLSPNVVAIYWASSTIYNGGPAPDNVGTGAQDGSIVGSFLRSIGGSPYWNINSTYTNGSGAHVQNALTYVGFWATSHNAPVAGSAPGDADMQALINYGFQNGFISYDANTIYEIFTASGVNLGGGFGSSYCAYHGHFTSIAGDTKYAADPYDYEFPTACSALNGSPNNDPAADAEVNTLAHETEEFTTDPDLNAWYDRRGNENADKCAWTFGTTFTSSNGSTVNMTLSDNRSYLIQRNWVNAGSGGCLVHYP